MAVRSSGDCRLMEQVGEKQDFESALTQRGLRHEYFSLRVDRPVDAPYVDDWTQDYTVIVVCEADGSSHRYAGGPRHDWVAQFVLDVTRGVYVNAAASQIVTPCLATAPERGVAPHPSGLQHRAS